MACYNRMERSFLQGLLWMYLLGFGFMALSLEPGFLDFDNLPDTNFTCVGKVIGGYYADLETNCQMFHVCTIGQLDEPMDIRFLCLNGTVFDQETRVCERIDEVDCTKSEQFYSLNLELYGNSQLSNLEENPETEQPLIIKSTPPSTTTPTEASPRSTSRPAYYATATPSDGGRQQQRLPSHHFPVVDANTSPDIRFNPEEINISLNAGAPPNFRTNQNHPVSYYSDKKVTGLGAESKTGGTSTQRSGGGSGYRGGEFGGYERVTPREVNFGFKFGESSEAEKEEEEEEYGTEETKRDNYHFQTQYKPSQQYAAPPHESSSHHFPSSTYRSDFSSPATAKASSFHHQKSPSIATTSTTVRNHYVSAPERRIHYDGNEESPQRIKLPLPPELPTLTFSTPAPFSLQRRVEQKRYTKDHLPPPRIVISASASVSDASGRRLNYSLGTIDTSPLLKQPPATYDEYKDDDVVLDPFYLDVQKLKSRKRRRRRSAEEDKLIGHHDIIKNDEDAVRVLKFLFDWYRNEKTDPSRLTTPLTSQGITAINDELSPEENEDNNDSIGFEMKSSDVFDKRSKYSLIDVGGVTTGHEEVKKINNVQKHITFKDNGDETFEHEDDYINDNYEPAAYDHKYGEFGFGYNEGKEHLHEFARHEDEYVDDNIEPIYYRDQTNEYSNNHEDYPAVNQLEQFGNRETTTEDPETTETPQATEKSTTTTTSRSSNNRRRGRRKNKTESIDKDENKTHIDKTTEKPYRAKDDYDYLRTVHVHTSSPKIIANDARSLGDTTEESYQATGNVIEATETFVAHGESPVVSTKMLAVSSTGVPDSEPDRKVFDQDISITTSTTTESFGSGRRRRGKHKHQDETNQKKSHRRRKPPKPPEARPSQSVGDAIPVGGSENASSYDGLLAEVSIAGQNQSSVDYSAVGVLEATTKSQLVKSRRGRMKFLSLPDPDPSEDVSATSRQGEVVGTPNLTSTESLLYHSNDSVPNESFPQATSTTIVENSTYAYSKHLEDVYATAFVPTTDSLHMTKKKQLKENLLNSEFPTTESSLELNTRRGTDTTEDYTQSSGNVLSDFWSTDDLVTIDGDFGLSTIKSSFVSDVFVTEGKEVFESTSAPITLETTTTTNVDEDHIFSRAMNLVSIAVEEKSTKAVPTAIDTTTVRDDDDETFPVTDRSSHNDQPYTEEEGTTEESLSQIQTSIATAESAVDPTAAPTDSPKPPVAPTEPPVAPTEPPVAPTEPPVDHTELPVAPTEPPVAPTVVITELPAAQTEPHVAIEELPVAITEPPVSVKEPPVVPTEPPVAIKEPPVAITEPPVAPTEPPVAITEQPVAFKEPPVAIKEPPVAITAPTVAPTEPPVAIKEPPVTITAPPVAPTEPPVAIKEPPVALTEPPVAVKEPPIAVKEPPVAPTEPPVATKEPPVAIKEPPVAPTKPPVATTEPPVAVASTTNLFRAETTAPPDSTDSERSTTSARPQRRRGGEPSGRRAAISYGSRHRFVAQQFARRGGQPLTEYPVRKSVNPTQAERALATTPLSRVRKHFFNCFGKEVDKFYPDSRDCRLFHYCTRGYNENQLLDMKFVCDFNTFFDDEKVICTKAKPKRCL